MGRFVPKGLRAQLVALVLLVLVPLLVLQVVGITRNVSRRMDAAQVSEQELADAFGAAFENDLQSIWNSETYLATPLIDHPAWTPQQMDLFLRDRMSAIRGVAALTWLDPNGTVLVSTDGGPGGSLAQAPYIQSVLHGLGDAGISDLISGPGQELRVQVVRGIRNDGQLMGILCATVHPNDLASALDVDRLDHGTFGLVDRQGMIVYKRGAPNPPLAHRHILPGSPANGALAGKPSSGRGYKGLDGSLRVGAAVPVEPVGWAAFASVRVRDVEAAAQADIWNDSLWLLLVTAISVGAALLIGRRWLRPLVALQHVATAVADGKMTARVLHTGQDELAATTQIFDQMVDRLAEVEAERDRFFNLSVDLLGIIDITSGYLLRINPAWRERLGYSTVELWAMRPEDLIHPADHPHELTQRLADGEPVLGHQARLRAKDGTYRWFLWNSVPDIARGRAYAVARDITDFKRHEESLQYRARQQAAVAALGLRALAGLPVDELLDEAAVTTAAMLGVEYTSVMQLLPDGQHLRLVAGIGWREGLVGNFTTGLDSLSGLTLRQSEPIMVEDIHANPRFTVSESLKSHGVVSALTVMIGSDHPFGVLSALTAERRQFSPDDLNFVQAMANVLAAAVQRAQLEQERERLLAETQAARAAAEAMQWRTAFLAEASRILASSLDYPATLQGLANLAVPTFADSCIVYTVNAISHILEPVAMAFANPALAGPAWELFRRNPISVHEWGLTRVIDGESVLVAHVSDEALTGPAENDEHLQFVRDIGVASLMLVPLTARGRNFGVLSLCTNQPGRSYGPDDLILAQELAQRAAVAVDNALLYGQAHEALQLKAQSLELLERSEALLADQKRILERTTSGAPLVEILHEIGRFVNRHASKGACSIFLVDQDGIHMHRLVTPTQPPDSYLHNDWVRVGIGVGSASAAVYRKEPVIVPDITTDPIWQERREMALQLGVRASSAVPIMAKSGEVLGAIAMYYRTCETPSDADLDMIGTAAHLCALVIEQKRAEEAQGEKLRALIANMSEGVLAIDENPQLLVINPAAAQMLHVPGPTSGRSLDELGLPESFVEAMKGVTIPDTPRSGRLTLDVGGSHIDARISALSVGDRRYGAIALLEDVTEALQFRRLQESFVANFSHELRGPLATLGAVVQGLCDGVIPPEVRPRYERGILDEIERLRRLTDSLLEMSRADAGVLELHHTTFDLAKLCHGVATKLQARCRAAGIVLDVQAEGTLRIKSDRDRVEQVLLNLLDNAIRFTPPAGTIALRATRQDGGVRVEVRDTGPGIPREHLPYIWERFYKVDQARTRTKNSGSGLGLSLVRDFVTRLGGEVGVESEVGQGTTFFCTLPLQ